MGLLDQLKAKFQKGDSWMLIIVLLVVSVGLCVFMCHKRNIVSDWLFEPMVEVPKSLQKQPIVKTWFMVTRGAHYVSKLNEDQSVLSAIADCMKPPEQDEHIKTDSLITGWAFTHFLLHFCIAFLCPKLVPAACMIGIAWEIMESYYNMHCVLDVVWNLCGSVCGFLLRSIVFPPLAQ